MNHLLTFLFAMNFIISAQAQNLLSNGSFENPDGSVNCDGLYDDYGYSLSFACVYNFWQVEFVNDTPPITPSESWSILIRSDFPNYGIVKSYVSGISGTHIYQLNYYMKQFGSHSGGVSIEVGSQNHSKSNISSNSEWELFSIVDTISTQATDTIEIKLFTLPADFCDCGALFDKVELTIIESSLCTTQDIVFSEGSTVQGNFRTAGKILSGGTVTDQTKFMASNRITLNTGFSTPKHLYFKANNWGCTLYGANWNEVNLDPYDDIKMYLPDTYSVNTWLGIDTWAFSALKNNDRVSFNVTVSPFFPATELNYPLPATYFSFSQQQIIYSTYENDTVNGVLYSEDNNDPVRDQRGIYLHFDGNKFIYALSVEYALEEYSEVIAILEGAFY